MNHKLWSYVDVIYLCDQLVQMFLRVLLQLYQKVILKFSSSFYFFGLIHAQSFLKYQYLVFEFYSKIYLL